MRLEQTMNTRFITLFPCTSYTSFIGKDKELLENTC